MTPNPDTREWTLEWVTQQWWVHYAARNPADNRDQVVVIPKAESERRVQELEGALRECGAALEGIAPWELMSNELLRRNAAVMKARAALEAARKPDA